MFATPRKRARPRFSLLTCLEHGELYFGSHAASLHPTADQAEALSLPPRVSALAGRLMVASKSLTFEPDDPDAPLVRMVLKDVPRPLIEWAASTHEVIGAGAGAGGFEIHVRMLAARMERYQPLRTIKLAPTVPALRFSLQHTRPISFVNLLNSILDLSMKPHDSAAQARLQQLHAESEQVSAVTFDQTALVDPLEAQLMQLRVQRVRPMLTLPGLLLLTESRLYIAEPACIECPLTHWPLAALERVVCRRYLLRDVALELHFRRGSGADGGRSDTSASSRLNPNDPETLLVALPSRTARDQLLETVQRTAWAVLGRSLPPPPEASLREQTERWRHGLIDNFTYLLFLNDCAGRSLGDLAQYPVFPWVLADVTSTSLNLNAPATFRDLRKPVGALNEKRLAIFRERYDSMEPGQRFLYGTHYSAPAFVSYFLLRLAPELTLHLHGGSFDTADREFTSISEAWHSVLSSSSDVKELIPHFYHPPSASFLLNGRHLDLGVRSDGTPVGDVLLPPWASDATDFVTKCRAALESELCSSQLHRWIDLIFGYSQRGIAADEAHNLFCPQTYEADYSNLPAMDRRALESQVAEFGQTPLQLFIEPHPPRLAGASQAPLVAESELLAGLRAAAHEQARSVGYGDAAGAAFDGNARGFREWRLGCSRSGRCEQRPEQRRRPRARRRARPKRRPLGGDYGRSACARGALTARRGWARKGVACRGRECAVPRGGWHHPLRGQCFHIQSVLPHARQAAPLCSCGGAANVELRAARWPRSRVPRLVGSAPAPLLCWSGQGRREPVRTYGAMASEDPIRVPPSAFECR